MIVSLISMSIDSVYLVYWLIKNGLYGTYCFYRYMIGYDTTTVTIELKELKEIKNKMEHQEEMLKELQKKMNETKF